MKTFSILHQFETTQFLVDTTFNHQEDEFELSIKFWCVPMNGYATLKMSWGSDKELDCQKTFEDLKSAEKAMKWMKGFEAKYISQ